MADKLHSDHQLFVSRVLSEVPLRVQHMRAIAVNSTNLFHCIQALEREFPAARVFPVREHDGTYFRIEDLDDDVYLAGLYTATSTAGPSPVTCRHPRTGRFTLENGRQRCKYCGAILEKGA